MTQPHDPGPTVKDPEPSPAYEDWELEDLHRRALDVGILGRADMNKNDLINALRNR